MPVKLQFRPTLTDLLGPRFRHASPAARRAWIALGVAVIAAAIALAVLFPRDPWIVHNGAPLSFELQYPRDMSRVAAPAGTYAAARQPAHGRLVQSLQVAPLVLPPFSGDVSAELPVYASGYIDALAARTSGFRLSSEGKTRVDTIPGYWLAYTSIVAGRPVFGRVVFLVPKLSGVRDGVALTMLTRPRSNVGDPDQVAVNGELYDALHSFRFTG